MANAQEFHQDAEVFRKKILLAIQESRVDDWTAERMLYVVDYLDVLLHGFFAFQDVLWERFGNNGDRLASHLAEHLDKRLQYVSQESGRIARDWKTSLDEWKESIAGLPEQVETAIQQLPEELTRRRVQDAMEATLSKAMEALHQDPERREALAKTVAQQYADLLAAARPEMERQLIESLRTGLEAEWTSALQSLGTDALKSVERQIEAGIPEALGKSLATALLAPLGETLRTALQAHLQAHPVCKSFAIALNEQTQMLTRQQESVLSALQRIEDKTSLPAAVPDSAEVLTEAMTSLRRLQEQVTQQGEAVAHLTAIVTEQTHRYDKLIRELIDFTGSNTLSTP
jgi:gas vesicle protein